MVNQFQEAAALNGHLQGPRLSPAEASEQRIRRLEQHIQMLRTTAGVNPLNRQQREALQGIQGEHINSAFGVWSRDSQARLPALQPQMQTVLANVEQHVGNPLVRPIRDKLRNVEQQMNRTGPQFNIVTMLASVDGLNIALRNLEPLLTAGGPAVDAIHGAQDLVEKLIDALIMTGSVLPTGPNPMTQELMPGSRMQLQNQATTIAQLGGLLVGGVLLTFGLWSLSKGKGGGVATALGAIATFAAFNANNRRTFDNQAMFVTAADRWQNEISHLAAPRGEYMALSDTYKFRENGPQWADLAATIRSDARVRTLIGKGTALTPDEKTELLNSLAAEGNPIRERVSSMITAKTLSSTQPDTDLQVFRTIIQRASSVQARAFMDSYIRSGATPGLMAGVPTTQMA